MAAKDYQICFGWKNAYISKVSKKDPNLMLSDRREITEEEILYLLHWWASKKKDVTGKSKHSITVGGEKVLEVVVLKGLDEIE